MLLGMGAIVVVTDARGEAPVEVEAQGVAVQQDVWWVEMLLQCSIGEMVIEVQVVVQGEAGQGVDQTGVAVTWGLLRRSSLETLIVSAILLLLLGGVIGGR